MIFIGEKRLIYLTHPDREEAYSGFGLPLENKYHLVGLLLIDRPYRADDEWLHKVREEFGQFHLDYMTPSGERAMACRMKIDADSRQFLKEIEHPMSQKMEKKLYPLLEHAPVPTFAMRWDDQYRAWVSEFDLKDIYRRK